MNQIFLDDPGITVPNKFTRKADKTINNKKLAIFELSGLFDLQNLTGSFEQEDGKMLIDLPLFKRKVTGIIAFDQEKSQITSGEINLLAVVKMLSKTEGDQVKGDYNLKATLTIKNLGVN
jgi:hypothetical protein